MHDHRMTFNNSNSVRKDIIAALFTDAFGGRRILHLTKEKLMIPDTMIFIVLFVSQHTCEMGVFR